MRKCHNNCHEFNDCLCKKKCPPIPKECKQNKHLMQDCICTEWSVLNGNTQPIFQSGGFDQIFSSGFVSYDFGASPYVIVQFFNDLQQVGTPIKVFIDSSVAFTFTKFNRITVTCPNAPGDGSVMDDQVYTNACEGEICIKTKVPIDEEFVGMI